MPILDAATIARAAINAGWAKGSPDLVTAIAIALAESSGNTDATNTNSNGTIDYGLFQINSSHTDSGLFSNNFNLQNPGVDQTGSWMDAQSNANYAHTLYTNRGNSFGDWTTYNNGDYLKHISEAQAGAANPSLTVPHSWSGGGVQGTSTLDQIVSSVQSIAGAMFKAGAWAGNSSNWGRVAIVVIGGALVVGAVVVASKPYLASTALDLVAQSDTGLSATEAKSALTSTAGFKAQNAAIKDGYTAKNAYLKKAAKSTGTTAEHVTARKAPGTPVKV